MFGISYHEVSLSYLTNYVLETLISIDNLSNTIVQRSLDYRPGFGNIAFINIMYKVVWGEKLKNQLLCINWFAMNDGIDWRHEQWYVKAPNHFIRRPPFCDYKQSQNAMVKVWVSLKDQRNHACTLKGHSHQTLENTLYQVC